MSVSLNYTSFASKAQEVTLAMSNLLSTGESVRLTNRHGQHWLLVTLHRDNLGYRFAFIDTDGREVGHMVLKAAVKVWSDRAGALFWSLNSKAYELKEHPATTLARKEAEQAFVEHMKAHGATHEVITYGGARLGYGAYQRNWYGKKCLYLVADSRGRVFGEAAKVSKEAELMVARLERLN